MPSSSSGDWLPTSEEVLLARSIGVQLSSKWKDNGYDLKPDDHYTVARWKCKRQPTALSQYVGSWEAVLEIAKEYELEPIDMPPKSKSPSEPDPDLKSYGEALLEVSTKMDLFEQLLSETKVAVEQLTCLQSPPMAEALETIQAPSDRLVDVRLNLERLIRSHGQATAYQVLRDIAIIQDGGWLASYLDRQKAWSSRPSPNGFGPASPDNDRTEGGMKHIEKEVNEVRMTLFGSPERLEELVDIFVLTMDVVWRNGFTAQQFMEMAEAKYERNRKRQWSYAPPGHASLHVPEFPWRGAEYCQKCSSLCHITCNDAEAWNIVQAALHAHKFWCPQCMDREAAQTVGDIARQAEAAEPQNSET